MVGAYVAEKDFGIVDKVKRDILSLYRGDIEKFGGTDALRIRRVFSTLPGQLARHEKKFVLSSLDSNARSREYADAFFWLADACISATCIGVDDPSVGLAATADEGTFKCYMADTGLLICQLFADNAETPHELYRDILLGKLEINEGMFTENVVAQQLAYRGEVDETLWREIAREVQGQVRLASGRALYSASETHAGGGRSGAPAVVYGASAVRRCRLPPHTGVRPRRNYARRAAPYTVGCFCW